MPQPKLSSKDKIRCCKHCNQKFVGAVPFVNHQIHCNYDAGPIYRPLDYNEPIPKREDYVKRSNLNKYTHRRRLPPKISRRDNYHDYTEFRKRLVKLHNMNFGDHEVVDLEKRPEGTYQVSAHSPADEKEATPPAPDTVEGKPWRGHRFYEVTGKIIFPEASRTAIGTTVHILFWPAILWAVSRTLKQLSLSRQQNTLFDWVYIAWLAWASLLLCISLFFDFRTALSL